ncbi:MAG: methanethiol S-methyltransferase [Planctomycetota bacterium]
MSRALAFLYGIACYSIFFVTFLYTIGFVTDLVVPKSISSGTAGSVGTALLINLGLIALFGIQHSVMARPGFKRVWTRLVPTVVERATYVLLSSVALLALFAFWQPLPATLWSVDSPALFWALKAVGISGFLVVLCSSFLIDHFDLFGLRQVYLHLRGREYTHHPFKTPGLYKKIRHPLYLGWLLAFWGTPVMTAGQMLFAVGLSAYIFIAIVFEERDLIAHFGDVYRQYRRETRMVLPLPVRKSGPAAAVSRAA